VTTGGVVGGGDVVVVDVVVLGPDDAATVELDGTTEAGVGATVGPGADVLGASVVAGGIIVIDSSSPGATIRATAPVTVRIDIVAATAIERRCRRRRARPINASKSGAVRGVTAAARRRSRMSLIADSQVGAQHVDPL